MRGPRSPCSVPGPQGGSLQGAPPGSVPRSAWLQALCSAAALPWRGVGRAGAGVSVPGQGAQLPLTLSSFKVFLFKCPAHAIARERWRHAAWMCCGLPPQLTPGLLRPPFPSRPHSGVFSPTFSPAHRGCSLAEKWTWPPASFLYLSRVSQCLAVLSASSARSLVTAKLGRGSIHSALFSG